jgi:hypothetical protein
MESVIIKEPDYEGFCLHMKEYEEHGIPTGMSDLLRLARRYNLPIPKRKSNPDGTFELDWTGTDIENINL